MGFFAKRILPAQSLQHRVARQGWQGCALHRFVLREPLFQVVMLVPPSAMNLASTISPGAAARWC